MKTTDPFLKTIIWDSYARSSTEMQTDSTSAQIYEADKFCKEMKWNLSDKNFEDFGVSGGNFKNWKTGQLGMFFDAIDNGEIQTPRGLIIESLSRFSRSDALEVANKFREYVRKGVYIHILQRGMTYEKSDLEGNNIFNLVMIILEAIANENMRQTHIKNVLRGHRNKKRKLLNGEIKIFRTKNNPSWIETNIVGTDANGEPVHEYSVNEEKADVIRRIFDERISGIGTGKIAQRMNDENIPQLSGHDSPWTFQTIGNVLRSRQTCGFISLWERKDVEDSEGNPKQKKVRMTDKDGSIVEAKIYPEIITEEKYDECRLEMEKFGKGRKTGKKNANVFSKLCFCGYCKKGLNVSDEDDEIHLRGMKKEYGKDFTSYAKQSSGSGGVYFICSNPNCKKKYFHEYYAETLVFKFLKEVNLDALFGQVDNKDLLKLERTLKQSESTLNKLEKDREKTYELLMNDDADEFLAEKYANLKSKIQNSKREVKKLQSEVAKETADFNNISKDWDRVLQLINDKDEGQTNRMILNKLLRNKIEKIHLFSEGLPMEKVDWDKQKFTMKNETMGTDRIALRIFFKGNVTRQIVFNAETETAISATIGDNKKKTGMKIDSFMFKLPVKPDLRESNRIGGTKEEVKKENMKIIQSAIGDALKN